MIGRLFTDSQFGLRAANRKPIAILGRRGIPQLSRCRRNKGGGSLTSCPGQRHAADRGAPRRRRLEHSRPLRQQVVNVREELIVAAKTSVFGRIPRSITPETCSRETRHRLSRAQISKFSNLRYAFRNPIQPDYIQRLETSLLTIKSHFALHHGTVSLRSPLVRYFTAPEEADGPHTCGAANSRARVPGPHRSCWPRPRLRCSEPAAAGDRADNR